MPLALETHQSTSELNLGAKKPVCDTVWAAVASDLNNSRFVIIDVGLKVNSQVYLNMLQKKLFIGSQKLFRRNESSYSTMLQFTQRSLRLRDKQLRSSSSPDLNPIVFAFWSGFGEGSFKSLPPIF